MPRLMFIQCQPALIFFFCSCFICTLSGKTTDLPRREYSADSVVTGHIRNCRFEKALEYANYNRKQAIPDSKEDLSWLLTTSEIYLRLGNREAGTAILDEGENILQRLQNPGHMLLFRYSFLKGKHMLFENRLDESLQWMHLAEDHARRVEKPDSLEMAMLYGDMGRVHYMQHEYRPALQYYRQALELQPLCSILGLHEASCLKALMADVCWYNNEKSRFSMLIQDCLAYLDTIADPLHPSLLEVYLKVYEYQLYFYDRYAISKDLSRNINFILQKFYPADHFYAGMFYCEEARDEYARCDFENALYYSRRSIPITSKYPFLYRYLGLNYKTIAEVYFWLERDYGKTIAFCNQAIRDLHHTRLSPVCFYNLIGLSHSMLRNKLMAINNFNKVLALASDDKPYHYDYDCALAYQELGRIYLLENDHITGRKYLLKGLALAKKVTKKGFWINGIYMDLGNSFNTTGDHRQALFCLQQSIIAGCNTFKDTASFSNPLPEDILLTYSLIRNLTLKAYILYSIYDDNKRSLTYLVNALKCQELAVKLIEKRIIDIDEEKSGLIMADLIRIPMNNTVSYAVLLYLKTGEKLYARKAWEYAEKSKMQVLSINTMKKNNLVWSGLPDTLIQKDEALNNEILEIENQLALEDKYGRIAGSENGALVKLARLYGQRNELTAFLEKNYPAFSRLKYNFSVAGMDLIQQVLDTDEVIVEYQLLSTEIITFVISKSDFRIFFQEIDSQVADNINVLRESLASNPGLVDPSVSFHAFTASSHFLYTKLIEPVGAFIRNKRLIIIPHNQLTLLPFEVLISRKPADDASPDYKQLPYLIRDFPIAYAFSANLLVDRNGDRNYGSGTAIFLPAYNPENEKTGGPGLSSLEGAASEALAIKRLTRGRLFRGNTADKSTFKAKADRYRILHIASHTMLDEKNPGLSCLVMTTPSDSNEDGNLYSYELMQMKLDAQLVVLSGCNTGYGLLRNCEGLVSLARSFFYTGVRTVALTLWPVADQAGSRLVRKFYEEIRDHETLDKALRKAKLNFLDAADPVKTHPFYWAGYIVVGKTDPVPLAKPYKGLLMVLSFVAFIILIYLVYRNIIT